jgi:hypothetical protein
MVRESNKSGGRMRSLAPIDEIGKSRGTDDKEKKGG